MPAVSGWFEDRTAAAGVDRPHRTRSFKNPYAHIMEGYTERSTASQQMLVDDESDLVYHIVCSRDRPDGKPHEDFEPLQTWWFTKDEKEPRRTSIPQQHKVIFKRSGEFSRDARRHVLRISQECYPLYDENETDYLPKGIATIHYLFCISDWLAISTRSACCSRCGRRMHWRY